MLVLGVMTPASVFVPGIYACGSVGCFSTCVDGLMPIFGGPISIVLFTSDHTCSWPAAWLLLNASACSIPGCSQIQYI